MIDLPDEPGFAINAGEASIRGFELEATVNPLDGLELHAGVGYVDSLHGLHRTGPWRALVRYQPRTAGIRVNVRFKEK